MMFGLLILLSAQDERVEFKFKDAPVETVVQYVGRVTGCAVLMQAKAAGTVEAYCEAKLTPDEALSFLDSVLARKGLAAVREGRTITILRLEDALKRPPTAEKVAPGFEIPRSDRVRQIVVPLRNLNVVQVRKEIEKLIPEGLEVSVAASPNAFVFTGRERDIAAVQALLAILDVSASEPIEVRVFALTHADGSSMVRMITDIFIKKGEGEAPDPLGLQSVMRKMGRPPGDAEPRTLASEIIRVAADSRSNAVAVASTRENLDLIGKFVSQLDAAMPAAKVVSYHLYHADATAAAKILSDLHEPKPEAARTGESARRAQRMWFGTTPNAPAESSPAPAALKAIADVRSNSVIVAAPDAQHELIREIVEDLDRPLSDIIQVKIYPLVNMEAADAVTTLQAMFKPRTAGATIEVTAESRTNAVIARALASDLAEIDAFLRTLDANPVEKESLFLYRPHNVDAQGLADTINAVLSGKTRKPEGPAQDPFSAFRTPATRATSRTRP